MYGPKITWADQTMVTNEQEYEKQQQPSNRNSELSFYLDFKSCTPLKTPSRKPSVLRQLVRDTRERFGKENSTGFNTAMNTGPIRMKFKNKKQQQVISAEEEKNVHSPNYISLESSEGFIFCVFLVGWWYGRKNVHFNEWSDVSTWYTTLKWFRQKYEYPGTDTA